MKKYLIKTWEWLDSLMKPKKIIKKRGRPMKKGKKKATKKKK